MEYKVWEQDQVEFLRASRFKQRLDGPTPDVPSDRDLRLDAVLRGIILHIIHERLIRIIRHHDLREPLSSRRTREEGVEWLGLVTHGARAALRDDKTWQTSTRAELEHVFPAI